MEGIVFLSALKIARLCSQAVWSDCGADCSYDITVVARYPPGWGANLLNVSLNLAYWTPQLRIAPTRSRDIRATGRARTYLSSKFVPCDLGPPRCPPEDGRRALHSVILWRPLGRCRATRLLMQWCKRKPAKTNPLHNLVFIPIHPGDCRLRRDLTTSSNPTETHKPHVVESSASLAVQATLRSSLLSISTTRSCLEPVETDNLHRLNGDALQVLSRLPSCHTSQEATSTITGAPGPFNFTWSD